MPERLPHLNYAHYLVKTADYLSERGGAIMQEWRTAVTQDAQLSVASQLDQDEFENQVGSLLQFLNREIRSECIIEGQNRLSSASVCSKELTKKDHNAIRHYAMHRRQHGYAMREVLLEWAHFNQTLVRILNEFESSLHRENEDGTSHPLCIADAVCRARVLATQLCDMGYFEIVTEYHRIQQAEVQVKIGHLAEELEQKIEWEHRRGQVLREAVHDLRGTLSSIQGVASLLDTAPPESQQAVSTLLQRSTGTLYQMLSELLDLSRLEVGHETCHVQPFDAAQLIQEFCQNTEAIAQTKGLTLTYSGPSNLQAEGDVFKVRRIAQNLLLNALKYTQAGGVSLCCREVGDDHWCLTVEDTGPGYICDDSVQLPSASHTRNSGEGVGLTIVKRLCKLLDAQLEVNTRPGHGTTFHVTWPRAYPAQEEA